MGRIHHVCHSPGGNRQATAQVRVRHVLAKQLRPHGQSAAAPHFTAGQKGAKARPHQLLVPGAVGDIRGAGDQVPRGVPG